MCDQSIDMQHVHVLHEYCNCRYIHPGGWETARAFWLFASRRVTITCNLQYKMLFRTLWITEFWLKKWMQNLLIFDKSRQTSCASDVDAQIFFNTLRRLSDPSVWKLSSTASCHYGTHNATASNAGIAGHLSSVATCHVVSDPRDLSNMAIYHVRSTRNVSMPPHPTQPQPQPTPEISAA